MKELQRINRRLEGLDRDVAEKALLLIVLAADQGIPVRLTSTLRTLPQQEALYAQGRLSRAEVNRLRQVAGWPALSALERNRMVTNARPGDSWHNWGRAFDLVPMQRHQNLLPHWASPWWKKLGELGKAVGLEWGGEWRKPDRPHFQDTGIKSLAMLKQEAGLA